MNDKEKEIRKRIRKLQWAVLGNLIIIVLMFFIIALIAKS